LICYIFILGVIGIGPNFLPPTINDYSWERWDGIDLSENITGNESYFSETFTQLSQPSVLYVYDLRDKSHQVQTALTVLQGLVNREAVDLFLIYQSADEFWLQQLEEYHGINHVLLNYSSHMEVFDRYKHYIDGLIIYDHNLLDSINVATFLAGVNNCVVIHENMVEDFRNLGITEIRFDLRNQFISKTELYSWAWDNFKQYANMNMMASLNPSNAFFRDYAVASNIFCFFLTPGPLGPTDEINLFKVIVSEYPDNVPVFGWYYDPAGALGEYEAVKILSKSGKYSFCAAIPDFTVFSSINEIDHKQKLVNFNSSKYKVGNKVKNKIYITCVVSDGDNVVYDYRTLQSYWQNPDRGSVPIGITLEPSMFKIFPTGLKYYYETATENEYFLAGPSGAGYCYVDLNPAFPQFLNHSKYAMDRADMDQVWILNGYEGFQLQISDEVLDAYASNSCDFSGIYINYHDYPAELNEIRNGVPIMQSFFVERENELVGKLESIYSASTTGNAGEPSAPIFVFIGFWAWDFSFTKLKSAISQLDSDTFVFLRPDHFSQLFIESQQTQHTESEIELIIFLFLGLIPVISLIGALIVINIKNQINERKYQENLSFLETFTNRAFFFMINFLFLLMIRFCLYSTILNLVALFFLILSTIMGIFLKKIVDKAIGVKANLQISIISLSLGSLLVFIDPKFIILPGFSIGMLFSHQTKLNSSLLGSKSTNKRILLYNIVFATALILLCPPESLSYLLFIAVIATHFISGLSIYYVINKKFTDDSQYFLSKGINHWYIDGVVGGFLLFFLLIPSFSAERVYFHIFWGVAYSPSRLTISFSIAALYIASIILCEQIKFSNGKRYKKFSILIGLLCGSAYIIGFIFLTGLFFFILLNLIFIYGILNCCIYLVEKQPRVLRNMSRDFLVKEKFTVGGFPSQLVFWLVLGLVLIFVPPAIIMVDSQEIFAQIGIPAISRINWASLMWQMFYLPSVYAFITIIFVFLVLIYGILSTLL